MESVVVPRFATSNSVANYIFAAYCENLPFPQSVVETSAMISEIARLNAELKEKKLILAKQEREEWQSIGWRNELKRKLGKLGARFSGSGEGEKQKSDESLPPHADL